MLAGVMSYIICVSITRGLPSQAFEYIHYNGGIESEKDYPYTAKNGKCHFSSSKVVATVASVVNITKVQTSSLKCNVKMQFTVK